VALAPLDALPPDSLHACDAPVDGENEPLILYRDPQGEVRAWRNVCPHAGRRLDFAPGQVPAQQGRRTGLRGARRDLRTATGQLRGRPLPWRLPACGAGARGRW